MKRYNSGLIPAAINSERQAEMLYNRLVKRRRHLRKWARRTGAGAYLLYDRDIPEIPLRLEYYVHEAGNDPALVSLSFYRRAGGDDLPEDWLPAMRRAAADALQLSEDRIFVRERERQRGKAQYGRLGADAPCIVNERGLRFRINLSGYLDTGLFLDRRLFRALIRAEAADRRVLNLFCYTASVSVAAAAGGAVLVDSLDISNTCLDRARDNFALNGFGRQSLRLIRADALRFVENARRTKQTWDMIIVDPPAFSNSKKMQDDFDLKRDHPALLADCLRLLVPGGLLYFSANVKGFSLDVRALEKYADIQDITEQLRDEDFKGKRIPAAYRIQKAAP